MMVTIIQFDRYINEQSLRHIFDDYPCDFVKYGVDEFNHSFVSIHDSDNVAYFSSSFINDLLKGLKCKGLEITILMEESEG